MHKKLYLIFIYVNVRTSVTSLAWKSVSVLWIFIIYMNWNGIQAAQALEAVWLCYWYCIIASCSLIPLALYSIT